MATPYRIETLSFAKSNHPYKVFYNPNWSTSKNNTAVREHKFENKCNLAFSPAIKSILRNTIVHVLRTTRKIPLIIDHGQVNEPTDIEYLRKRHMKIETCNEDTYKKCILEKTLIIDGADLNNVLLEMLIGPQGPQGSQAEQSSSVYISGHTENDDKWFGILPSYKHIYIKNCDTDSDMKDMTNDLMTVCAQILEEFDVDYT